MSEKSAFAGSVAGICCLYKKIGIGNNDMAPTPNVPPKHPSCSFFRISLDATIKRKMGSAKRWHAKECEAAAKAYVFATHDEIAGAQQKGADFGKRIADAFKDLSPPGCAGTGFYWDRDPDGSKSIVWSYVRDVMMKECQKFNGTYNKVLNMKLTGVTEQEKVNIAVAMFQKKLTADGKSVYVYKDYKALEWRLYLAWIVLKDTKKLQVPSVPKNPSQEIIESGFCPPTDIPGVAIDSLEDTVEEPSTTLSVTKKEHEKKSAFVGRDRAKKEALQDELSRKRATALIDISCSEKKKVKHLGVLADQATAQTLFAMLHSKRLSRATRKKVRTQLELIMNLDGTSDTLQDAPSEVQISETSSLLSGNTAMGSVSQEMRNRAVESNDDQLGHEFDKPGELENV